MAVESHDKKLDDLLKMVEEGKAQLPDFQRSWVWDDTKICKLIESITSGFPMGAAMFLANGGEHIRFKYRKFEGVESENDVTPEWLVLDGQQRLTTLYQVLKSKKATSTRLETNRDATIKRFYYLDIKKCLDPNADRLDAIVSVSDKKQQTTNIGRTVTLDLSTREKEFENLMFPLNITFSANDTDDWRYDMEDYYHNDRDYSLLFREFSQNILAQVRKSVDSPPDMLTKRLSSHGTCFPIKSSTFASWQRRLPNLTTRYSYATCFQKGCLTPLKLPMSMKSALVYTMRRIRKSAFFISILTNVTCAMMCGMI